MIKHSHLTAEICFFTRDRRPDGYFEGSLKCLCKIDFQRLKCLSSFLFFRSSLLLKKAAASCWNIFLLGSWHTRLLWNWLRWKTRYLSRNFWPDWSTWLCSYIDALLLKLQSDVQIINFFQRIWFTSLPLRNSFLFSLLFPYTTMLDLRCLIHIASSARERYNTVRNFQRFMRLLWTVLTLHTVGLTSLFIFSIVFPIHSLKCWQGEFL